MLRVRVGVRERVRILLITVSGSRTRGKLRTRTRTQRSGTRTPDVLPFDLRGPLDRKWESRSHTRYEWFEYDYEKATSLAWLEIARLRSGLSPAAADRRALEFGELTDPAAGECQELC